MNSALISNQGWCGAEGNSVDVGNEICRRPGVEAAEYGFPQRLNSNATRMLRRSLITQRRKDQRFDIDLKLKEKGMQLYMFLVFKIR